MRIRSCSSSVLCWKASALLNFLAQELEIIAHMLPDAALRCCPSAYPSE